MKLLKIIVAMIALLSFSFAKAEFAFSEPMKVVSTTDTSVTLEWEAVEGAIGYLISSAPFSIVNSTEDADENLIKVTDFLETTSTTIEELDTGKTYYFSIVAIDENGIETDPSEEIEVLVEATETISEAESLSGSNLEDNPSEELVESTTKEGANVIATEDDLNIDDLNIDDLVNSNDMDSVDSTELDDVELTNNTDVIDNENIDLNSAPENNDTQNSMETTGDTNTAVENNISNDDLIESDMNSNVDGESNDTSLSTDSNSTEEAGVDLNAASDTAKTLPQSGPREMLLLAFALLLGLGLFMYRRKVS